ncbi:MAG: DUF4215 domain-containing protein [Myxococcota bacterium]
MRRDTRRLVLAALALTLALGVAAPAFAGPTTSCGDGIVEVGEFCDDSNTIDGDGCSTSCISEICGDGILENNGRAPDEECDDGNTGDGDGCMGDCTCGPCGDGVQCGIEACDDGNTVDGDGCNSECEYGPGCGNGIVDGPEECDDGNTEVGDGCDPSCQIEPPAPYPPPKADQACVNAINKAWAGVLRASNKAGGKCLKGVSSGKVPGTFDDCAQAADLGKAFDKTTKTDQKKCVGKISPAMFGYVGDSTGLNVAAHAAALSAQADLLGSPANIVDKSDKEHAKCQQEAHKGLVQYVDGLAADANRNKKLCLKGKKVPQCLTANELAAAMTAAGLKSNKALTRWSSKVDKKCTDTAMIAAHFPGACSSSASYAELVTCSAERARCHFCASLNAADGLSIDCGVYAGALSGCGDSS